MRVACLRDTEILEFWVISFSYRFVRSRFLDIQCERGNPALDTYGAHVSNNDDGYDERRNVAHALAIAWVEKTFNYIALTSSIHVQSLFDVGNLERGPGTERSNKYGMPMNIKCLVCVLEDSPSQKPSMASLAVCGSAQSTPSAPRQAHWLRMTARECRRGRRASW